MEEIKFRHNLPIQLRFNDIDRLGHVNNSVYFAYYDLGKTDYFASVYPNLLRDSKGVVLVHLDTDFLIQVKPTDKIAVQTATIHIGEKSLTLMQQVINTETLEIKSTCKSTLVAFDLEQQQSIIIPDEWREAIAAYEI